MIAARKRVGPRPARQIPRHTLSLLPKYVWGQVLWGQLRRCFLLGSFLLAISGWLPLTAQTSPSDLATPDTVVLPPREMRMPLIFGEGKVAALCPLTSENSYESVPILNSPRNPVPPPHLDPDLNLAMRGYRQTFAPRNLIAINGPTDDDAPQLAHLFRPVRVPEFSAVYQVHDWDWTCCPGGKVGQPITHTEVTLVEMVTTPGEAIYPPRRNANIGHDFIALVLYAEETRLTFTYTREDTPAIGYLVHVEKFCVDPNLLALYQERHSAGRHELPALRRSDSIGTALNERLLVAVRDTGSFMDPRSAKDWWQDLVRALLAAETAPASSPP